MKNLKEYLIYYNIKNKKSKPKSIKSLVRMIC